MDTTCREISQCVLASAPGPHAIVMVVQLNRFTDEEQKTVALIKNLFGKSVMKHMIFVFTRKEELGDRSLSEFIAESQVKLRSIVKECGGRCVAFNNRAGEAEKEAQVQELVGLIEDMVQSNRGLYFCGAIYKDVEKKLKEQVENLKKIYMDHGLTGKQTVVLEMHMRRLWGQYISVQKAAELRALICAFSWQTPLRACVCTVHGHGHLRCREQLNPSGGKQSGIRPGGATHCRGITKDAPNGQRKSSLGLGGLRTN
ncbi:GTPase IMAP family member 7 [Galemys pyrenaicus]|uniref:GTPase IMAP family member 7 n=1 Tax=Galemys pyrenaicus TaxID=202257 RepID=A0A8J6A3Z9_GALPY|nr:GTPase IMAP family member 7 [Galemys pyrenaicus]